MKLCDELNVVCAKFWWGQVGNERKIHWKNWSFLSRPKNEGGMGFRDLRFFNLSMLAKQGWRLMHDGSSLLFQCFKARYFPRCNFLDVIKSPNCLYAWKSMVAAWKGRMLSRAGKEVLIKAVAQSIPTYTLGYFNY